MATILITGGSGLIGSALTGSLLASGHSVRHLGREARHTEGVHTFVWDPRMGRIDPSAVEGVDHIVHLAGAGIADKRWTSTRVRELIDSRAATSRLLMSAFTANEGTLISFVSAAGINYYGARTEEHVFTESDPPGTDTIGVISKEWEEAVDEWSSISRVVKLRTPIVLSSKGGALLKFAAPVRWGLGAPLGSGKQWMPWVHIDDLVRMYEHALFHTRMSGAYNANATDTVQNRTFINELSKALHRPCFLPAVPGVALKLALGELATLLLEGSRASNEKLVASGYGFQHPELAGALKDLLQ
ncbi:MAG: TIGR01777 family oxidoreductase [Flavobacteriales bacterium]|nr:TIGR01777 family oxidoreductase [Flavobacteriales bacterium]